MDTAESCMNEQLKECEGKEGEKASGSNPRAKATSWPAVISEFLLDWYLEKKLAMPPKTSFKKLHHTACTSAVNSKFARTYSVDQVHRHWRRHKDTWGLVVKYLNDSGGGWDESTKMVTLSQSTLNELSDPSSAADPDQDGTAKLDMDDMANYDKTDDQHGQDSDKLESNSDECQEVAALGATSSQVSSSSFKSMKPNMKNFKRVGKSNTLPTAGRIGRTRKSNTKPSPTCAMMTWMSS